MHHLVRRLIFFCEECELENEEKMMIRSMDRLARQIFRVLGVRMGAGGK